jgi:hypothetical protein
MTGVVLAGGALGAVLWWNAGGWRSSPAVASAGVTEAEALPSTGRPTKSADEPVALLTPSPTEPAATTTTGRTETPQTAVPATRPAGGEALPRVVATSGHPWAEANPITPASPAALVEGRQLKESGKLLDSRALLNRELLAGTFQDPGDAEAAKSLIREINQVLVFSPQRIAGDPWVDEVVIRPGDRLTQVANDIDVPYEMILKINGIADARRVRAGQRLKVIKGPIHAVVSKSRYTIDLYFGSPGGPDAVYLTSFRVGLGTDDSTPTGLWQVAKENKLKNPTYFSPRGEGVIHADDPQNPLGEFWIGLTGIEGEAVGKLSYGIHGTIEPDSIGKMASMGCIRLLNEDVGQLFMLLFEGRCTVRVVE